MTLKEMFTSTLSEIWVNVTLGQIIGNFMVFIIIVGIGLIIVYIIVFAIFKLLEYIGVV